MFNEDAYLTFELGVLPKGNWLVMAPHADDETFGMAGAIVKAVMAGQKVDVLVMTDGALGGSEHDLKRIREEEIHNAARVLECRRVLFLHQPDRGLKPSASLIAETTELIINGDYSAIFFPSPVEPHPDHRATAQIAWEALRKSDFPCEPISYEVSVQGPCNLLVDITSVVCRKKQAMLEYKSQISKAEYIERILGLNKSRAWSLPNNVTHAEAFYRWEKSNAPLAAHLNRIFGMQQSINAIPESEDLVSIIIRMTRHPQMLRSVIRSIVGQTHKNIELLVVDDGYFDIASLVREETFNSSITYSFIRRNPHESRSNAANIALARATGSYICFLDDDDLLLPTHISSLIDSVREDNQAIAAYGPTFFENEPNNNAYSAFLMLLLGISIPIHAAIFKRASIDKGIRFDVELSYGEEYDFFMQLMRFGNFSFCPIGAGVYRNKFVKNFVIESPLEDLLRAELVIYRKWSLSLSDEQMYSIINFTKQGIEEKYSELLLFEADFPKAALGENVDTIFGKGNKDPQALQSVISRGWRGAERRNILQIYYYFALIAANLDQAAVEGEGVVGRVKNAIEAYKISPELNKKINELEVALCASEQMLASLRNSRYWRMTSTLRRLGHLLRKVRNFNS